MKVTREMQHRANTIMKLINEFCEDFGVVYLTTASVTKCDYITIQNSVDEEIDTFTNIEFCNE